jgi:hypothetical protein
MQGCLNLTASGTLLHDNDGDELVAYLLAGLDEDYNSMFTLIVNKADPLAPSKLYAQLLRFKHHTNLHGNSTHRMGRLSSEHNNSTGGPNLGLTKAASSHISAQAKLRLSGQNTHATGAQSQAQSARESVDCRVRPPSASPQGRGVRARHARVARTVRTTAAGRWKSRHRCQTFPVNYAAPQKARICRGRDKAVAVAGFTTGTAPVISRNPAFSVGGVRRLQFETDRRAVGVSGTARCGCQMPG